MVDNVAGQIIMKPTGGTLGQAVINDSNLAGGGANSNPIVLVDGSAESGGFSQTTISNSFIHNTPGVAILVNAPSGGDAVYFMINNTTITQAGTALQVNGANGSITLNASTIAHVGTVASGAGVLSYGNNGINYYTTFGSISTMSLR